MATLPPAVKRTLGETFQRFLQEAEFYRVLVEGIAMTERAITDHPAEKAQVSAAFAVKIYTSWGIFIEQVLIDCLSCDTTQYQVHRDIDQIPKQPTRQVAELMLAGMQDPPAGGIHNIRTVARQVLVPQYNPFEGVASQVEAIEDFRRIRNYIAHQSRRSRRALEAVYARHTIKGFAEPGSFLLGQIDLDDPLDAKKSSRITRLGFYLNALLSAADTMQEYLLPGSST